MHSESGVTLQALPDHESGPTINKGVAQKYSLWLEKLWIASRLESLPQKATFANRACAYGGSLQVAHVCVVTNAIRHSAGFFFVVSMRSLSKTKGDDQRIRARRGKKSRVQRETKRYRCQRIECTNRIQPMGQNIRKTRGTCYRLIKSIFKQKQEQKRSCERPLGLI